jgi:hypothetical protein
LPNRQFDPCPSRSLLEMIVGELSVEACPGSGVQRSNRHLLLSVTCEKRHAAATLGIAFILKNA